MTLPKESKDQAIKDFQRDPSDTGSPEVQIAILTRRIEQLTGHLRTHKKDEHSRHGLLGLVSQRRRHLTYLDRHAPESYNAVTERLGIRRR